MNNLHVVIVNAWRHKWFDERDQKEDRNVRIVAGLIQGLKDKHGAKLHVIGSNDDVGFGAMVKRQCFIDQVPYANYICRMEQFGNNPGVQTYFHIGKNATMIEIGNEFFIYTLDNRTCSVEDLAFRVKNQTQKPYIVYGQADTPIEQREA